MRLLALSIFLILNSFVFGQNYQPINSNTAIFLGNSSDAAKSGFRSDSVIIQNQDSLFLSYPTFRIIETMEGECARLNSEPPLGQKVHFSSLGWTYFIRNQNDTIAVHQDAAINDSWVLFQQSTDTIIMGTVTELVSQEWLDTVDIVKVISMQAVDSQGQNINHESNGHEILIGETLGLLQFPDLYHWPHEVIMLQVVGNENLKMGIRRLSDFELYDFETCDEFHFEKHNETPDIPPDDNYYVKTVLARNETSNEYHYTFEISGYRYHFEPVSGWPPYVATQTEILDTIQSIYSKSTDISHLLYPDELVLEIDTSNLSVSWAKPPVYLLTDDRVENKIGTYFGTYYAQLNSIFGLDSCLIEFSDLCCHYPFTIEDKSYAAGLGNTQLFTVHADLGLSIVPVRDRLVHFDKCGTVWGNPIDESLLNQVTSPSPFEFSLYPNPTSESVQIQLKRPDEIELVVTDVLGKSIFSETLHSTGRGKLDLDVSDWPNGMYLISVSNQKGIRSTQQLIVHH